MNARFQVRHTVVTGVLIVFAARSPQPAARSPQPAARGPRTADGDQYMSWRYTRLMPRMIIGPTVVQAAGNKPKQIEEYAGRVNSGHAGVSVARMRSPEGWEEPGQRPEFEEITIVLRGTLRVEYEGGVLDVGEEQAVITAPGEWVRYSTPFAGGAEYIAVCLPAFSVDTVHRDS
jgi:mannose-6-phosphate isomerase-like protein (cupin superfamily)